MVLNFFLHICIDTMYTNMYLNILKYMLAIDEIFGEAAKLLLFQCIFEIIDIKGTVLVMFDNG